MVGKLFFKVFQGKFGAVCAMIVATLFLERPALELETGIILIVLAVGGIAASWLLVRWSRANTDIAQSGLVWRIQPWISGFAFYLLYLFTLPNAPAESV